jgi:hypothetical protein
MKEGDHFWDLGVDGFILILSEDGVKVSTNSDGSGLGPVVDS